MILVGRFFDETRQMIEIKLLNEECAGLNVLLSNVADNDYETSLLLGLVTVVLEMNDRAFRSNANRS